MKSALVLILSASICQTSTGDWNQFLGPNRNGAISTGNLIPGNPRLSLAWSRDLGQGYSGILVSDGHLFTMHRQGTNDVMTCMSADTGETEWQYEIGPFFPAEGSAPGGILSTPALDQEQVYGLGARGELSALERASGKEVWKVHLRDELGGTQPGVGFTTSPLIIGNRVIVQIGNPEDSSIGALDTESGELVWSSGTGAVSIQSPSLVEFLGQTYLISLHGNGISGLDPETGKVLWNHVGKAGVQVLPTGEDSFLINMEGLGYVRYQLIRRHGTIVLEELWRSDVFEFLHDIPVIHDGLAFAFKGGFLTCLDLETGKRVWKERMHSSGATVLVDGHLVVWCDGKLRLAEASREAYEEAALIGIFAEGEEDSITMPSYARGHFYVRNSTRIAAVKVGR